MMNNHFGKHRFVIDATGGHETDADGDAPAGNRTMTGSKPVRRKEIPESSSKTTGLVRRVYDSDMYESFNFVCYAL